MPGVLRTESYRKGILYSTSFNVLAKALGFCNNIVIAYYFGTQAETGVYFYAFATVTALAGLLTSLNASVIIPESMRLRIQTGDQQAMRFLNFFLVLYAMVGLAVTLVVSWDPVSFYLAFSKFDFGLLHVHADILRWSIPLFFLVLIANYLTDVLTSYKFFTLPMIASMLNSVLSLTAILVFHERLGVVSILVGLIVASIIQLAALLHLMRRVLAWDFAPRFVGVSSLTKKNLLYAQLGNVTSSLAGYVPLYLLSGYDAGIIAALTYGQRIADLPTSLIVAQVSTVVGIRFNELFARGEHVLLDRVFRETARILLFVLVPISVFVLLFGREITLILFHRGSFDTQAVDSTSLFLRLFVVVVPMLAVSNLVSRVFMAGQRIRASLVYQIAFNVCLLILIHLGVRGVGVSGYPLAMIVMHVLNMAVCYWLLRSFFASIAYSRVLVDGLRIVALNVLIGGLLYFLTQVVPALPPIPVVVGALVIYAGSLALAGSWFGFDDQLHGMVEWAKRSRVSHG